MTHTQSGFAKINGASLYYEVAGNGHPFIMLHGHLLDCRQWDDQFAEFAKSQRVVRYDARGFGRSILPAAPYSHIDDLHALMGFLNIERATLMGCSGGGGICIDFTLQHPEQVDGLILLGASLSGYRPTGTPPPKFFPWMEAQQRGDLEQAVELSLQLFTDGEHRSPQQVNASARERMRVMTAGLYARPSVPEAVAQLVEPPAVDRLADIRVPTLAIVGSEDNAMLHTIADLFTSQTPGATKLVIRDAGHHANMEHPEVFNRAVASFLEQRQPE